MSSVIWIRGVELLSLPREYDALRLCTVCIKPAYMHVNNRCLLSPHAATYLSPTYLVFAIHDFLLGTIASRRACWISDTHPRYLGTHDSLPKELNITLHGLYGV